jgi:bacterioferritin (cytochrome b1)
MQGDPNVIMHMNKILTNELSIYQFRKALQS